MKARIFASSLGAAMVALAAPLALPAQSAHAAPAQCSDIEVVFGRGTAEPPGLGNTGASFAGALRLLAGGKSVNAYPVNYQASADFGNRNAFAESVVNGVRDAQAHIISTAKNCPNTKIVLGGYSQGAVVTGFALMPGMPAGLTPEQQAYVPPPLPPEAVSKIAANINFGKPSDQFMKDAGAPPIIVAPNYASKTSDYCIPFDNICDGAPLAQPNPLHVLYPVNGMTLAGAQFAVSHL